MRVSFTEYRSIKTSPKTSVKETRNCFGLMINLTHANLVTFAKQGRPIVLVIKAIHNKITAFLRAIEAKLGLPSYATADRQTLSTGAKNSESPRW